MTDKSILTLSKKTVEENDPCFWSDMTDLRCVCINFLEEIKKAYPKSICVALSESILTYYAKKTEIDEMKTLDADKEISIRLLSNPQSYEDKYFTPVIIRIDPNDKIIKVEIFLQILFYKGNQSFAKKNVSFSLRIRPTLHSSYFDFTTIIDKSIITAEPLKIEKENVINEVYGNIANFEQKINELLNEFIEIRNIEKTDFGQLLPAIVSTIELPEDWRYLERVNLTFVDFYYKAVRLGGVEQGCLFAVFTVENNQLPPQYSCEDLSHLSKNKELSFDRTSDPTRWIIIGIREEALLEIMKAYIDMHVENSGKEKYTRYIEGEFKTWINVQLSNLKLKNDGLEASLQHIDAGGKATVKEKVFNGGKLTTGIRLTLKDVEIILNDFKIVFPANSNKMTIITNPKVEIGDIYIDINPSSQEFKWLTERIKDNYKGDIENELKKKLKFPLFNKPRVEGDYFIIENIFNDFSERTSSMLIGIQISYAD